MKKIAVLLALFIFLGCDMVRVPPPSTIEALFEKKFGPSSVAPATPCTLSAIPFVEIYFDASGSMTGFIRNNRNQVGGTGYCKALANLDAYLKSTRENPKYNKFGTSIHPINSCNNAIKQEWFYDQKDTRLAELFSSLSSRSCKDMPKAFLIISDGIQSTPDHSDFKEMIDGISKWLLRGFHFEMLLLRSEFNGLVYSEVQNGRRVGRYRSSIHGTRPFYVFILSPIEGFGQKILDGLRSYDPSSYDTSFTRHIRFTSELCQPGKVGFKTMGSQNSLINLTTQHSIFKYLSWKSSNQPTLSDSIQVGVQLIPLKASGDFILNPDGISCKVEAADLGSKEAIPSPEVGLINTAIENKKGINNLVCRFNLKEVKKGEWVIYRIAIKPGPGTVCPPKWVDEVSTNLDTSPNCFSKTLFLREFVTSVMMSPRLTEEPLAVFYLAIKGRKP